MTSEQEIQELKAQTQSLRELLATQQTLNVQLVERTGVLENRLAQDSYKGVE